jgi:Ni,Fe-hydrogenase III large subunit
MPSAQTTTEECFRERVLKEAAGSGVPLGAYADAESLHYLFLHEASGPFALSHRCDATHAAAAVSGAWPTFSWDEREMAQERGVCFDGLADPRPLRAQSGVIPEAIVAHGEGLMNFVVGPVHAGIIEPGRFVFSSGGETVVHIDAQLGYAHRGIERALEGCSALACASRVARICGSCSAARSLAYARALETLSGVEVSASIDLARLVVAELERIYNHLGDLAASSSGAGWAVGFAHGMALKEEAMRLNQIASGHRLLFDAIVPGGVSASVLAERRTVRAGLAALERRTDRYLRELFGNASLISRWHGAGIVSHDTSRAFGAVGPAHRASHGTVDVRSFSPYGAYRSLPLRVARASTGDTLARCQVKRAELLESFRIIREALAVQGDAALPVVLQLSPAAGSVVTVVEGPRGAEVVALRTERNGTIARLHVISASYRNWPLVTRAMEGNIVPDFPLVNKSFNLCYACVDR